MDDITNIAHRGGGDEGKGVGGGGQISWKKIVNVLYGWPLNQHLWAFVISI